MSQNAKRSSPLVKPTVAFKPGVNEDANLAGTAPLRGVIALAGDDHVSKSSTLAHQSDHISLPSSATMSLGVPAGATRPYQAPAFYLIGCGLVSLLGLAMVPETLGRRLQ
ncbi:hypothetical protein [Cupriavidus lacunae]|uniref:Uncharacterized protein n=1 Tax=Cupriavidus lacunae TaxID=2666307 RepID=A0A370NQ82_9BURK|nr:hypothetical protein [Cupriavidus lacunae]RDK07683.1 hypothetical protein DN412_24965 [Cupriavidus lacunae]